MSEAHVTADRYAMATLDRFVGHEIALSDWTLVDQQRIDAFADCTGDRQWIHVDAERAARESPFGGTIAHGYLTLSLAASTAIAGAIPHDARRSRRSSRSRSPSCCAARMPRDRRLHMSGLSLAAADPMILVQGRRQ